MRIYIYFVRIISKIFYKLLSKKEKKIKKNQFFTIHPINLIITQIEISYG